uniref:Uncharacterized protein n=1 Tax=Rhizophora mucronata TaxID=61149 RepID=A0A2P2IH46_RHIMU
MAERMQNKELVFSLIPFPFKESSLTTL